MGALTIRAGVLVAGVLLLTLISAGAQPASAVLSGPRQGSTFLDSVTIQTASLPAGADPFHDFQGFCLLQTLTEDFPPLVTYLYMDESGNLTGQCTFTDHYFDITETNNVTLSGSVNLDTLEITFEVHKKVIFDQPESRQTKTLNFGPVTGTLTESGTFANGKMRGPFSFSRLDECFSCEPRKAYTSSGYSYGGTVEASISLGPVNSADLSIDHIEVVQVVQTANNDMRLVANKATVARVFVRSTIPIDEVELTLKGKRGATDLGEPLLINGSGTSAYPVAERNSKLGSFNFRLPANWTTVGSITLEAEAMPPDGTTDPKEDNNKGDTGATFYDRRGLSIAYLPVCHQPAGQAMPNCPSDGITGGASLLQRIFPVRDGGVTYAPVNVPNWIWTGTLDSRAEGQLLMAALRKRYDLMKVLAPASLPDQLAAWIPQRPGIALGSSDPAWLGSSGRVSYQQFNPGDPEDSNFTLAHEIAHNLGRRHTNKGACGDEDGGTDWPYDDNTIQEYGWDIQTNQVVSKDKSDVMTYCSPPATNIWMSPHTWDKLFDGNFAPQSLDIGAAGGAQEYLVISGSALADGSAGTLDPAYTIESSAAPDPSEPNGTHCLRFGPFVVDYCFTPQFEDHRTHDPLPQDFFSLTVPFPDGSTSVALMTGATELARLEASANAPSLNVADPAGDWTSGSETLTWSAPDGDGDPVLYTVLYSTDGGTSWLPIEVDTPASQFTFDVAALEASEEGMFRVLASDGLNTSVDTTPPVQVGQVAPKGDVDCSGGRTSVDALVVLQLASNLVDSAPCEEVGDVNCDMDVNSLDALFILQDISGFDVSLPAGCPPFE